MIYIERILYCVNSSIGVVEVCEETEGGIRVYFVPIEELSQTRYYWEAIHSFGSAALTARCLWERIIDAAYD